MFLEQFYSDITVDSPVLWLLFVLFFIYLYKRTQTIWTLNLGIFFSIFVILGLFPDGLQHIIILSLCITFIWSIRLAFCDLCIGCIAPFFMSKYRRIQFGEHIGRIEHFYVRHFCLYNDQNEKIHIPYHQYLTQEFRFLDSISKVYIFPFPDEHHNIRIQYIKNYLFDSPFSDSNKWTLEVKDNLYIHLQLFREEDSVLLQQVLHKIFYQPIEEEGL